MGFLIYWSGIITITVNGKKVAWHQGLTIEKILENLDEKDKYPIVVVKVNGKPILKKEHSTYEVPDNAEVNTVEVIAGG